jgi:dolichol-phosphate mannosyltransferase
MFRLTQNLFGVPSAWVAAALMQILPFFFLSNMVMNPDAPLTAAWVASLYFLERALIARQARAWWGVGLCLGLGLLSKYTIALLAASACLFLLLDGQSRIWWRRAEPYWAALLALAIFSPVILWNALHEWASFAFQVSRRLAAKSHFSLQVSVASAIVLLTPIGLAAATVLLRRRAPNIPGDEPTDRQRAWRFLQISAGLPLFFLAGFSLFHQIELDWSGPAWTAALPAIAFGIVHKGDPWKKGVIAWLRIVWVPTLLVLLVFDGLRFYYFTAGIPGLGYGEHPENIPVGWRELGRQVNQLAAQSAAAPLIVGMDPYFLAGELAFYAPDPNKAATKTASGHLFGHTGLMYERWFPLEAERGRALLLVAWDPDVLDSPEVRGGVESLAAVQVGDLTRNGRPIRRFYYRFAYGYRGLTPVVSPTER